MEDRFKGRLLPFAFLTLALLPQVVSVAADSDLWWQLKVGCDMIGSGGFLYKDPYSYASGLKTWVNHEWLPQLVWGKLYLLFGDTGLLFMRGVIFGAIVFVLYLHHSFAGGSRILAAMVVALFSTPLLGFFANLRPRIFTFLFLALLLLTIEIYRRRRSALLYLLPVVFLIWCNSHGGFLLGYGVLLAGVFSLLFTGDGAGRKLSDREKGELVTVSVLSLLALLCTPYGVNLPEFVIAELGTGHPHITEWEPVSLAQLPTFLFLALLPIGAALFGREYKHFTLIFAFAVTMALTARYSRFLPLFYITGSMLFFASLPGVMRRSSGGEPADPGRMWRWISAAVLIPVGAWGVFIALSGRGGITIDEKRYPIAAVEFLKARNEAARLALPFDWGGYAIWHLVPPYKVGIDGRYASVYEEAYVNRQIEGYKEGSIDDFLAGESADYALVPADSFIADAFERSGATVIYRDEVAKIFRLSELYP